MKKTKILKNLQFIGLVILYCMGGTLIPAQAWDKAFGVKAADRARFGIKLSDGVHLLAGGDKGVHAYFYEDRDIPGFNHWTGSPSASLIKINNSDGTFLWSRNYGHNTLFFEHLSSFASGIEIPVRKNKGNYLMVGFSTEPPLEGVKDAPEYGGGDIWLVGINDFNGDRLWDTSFGGSEWDEGIKIIKTSDGGALIAGNSTSGIGGNKVTPNYGGYDVWVIKLDSNYVKQWEKNFGGNYDDFCEDVIQTSDGGYLIASESFSDANTPGGKRQGHLGEGDIWVIKIDSNGERVWDKVIGYTERDTPAALIEENENSYIVVGSSQLWLRKILGVLSYTTRGELDYFVAKLTNSGAITMQRGYGGTRIDKASTAFLEGNNLVIGGSSESPISGEKTLPDKGYGDYWMLKVNKTSGDPTGQACYGSSGWEELADIIPIGVYGSWLYSYIYVGLSAGDVSGDRTVPNLAGPDPDGQYVDLWWRPDLWLIKKP